MIKQKLFSSFFSEIIIYFLGFISIVVVARFIGPEQLGLIANAVAITNILAIIGNLGFGIAHVKKVSEGEDLGKCIGVFLTLKLITITLMILAYIIINTFFYDFLSRNIKSNLYSTVLLIIFIGTVFNSLFDILNFTFTAKLWIAKGKTVLILSKLSNSLLKIIVAVIGLNVIYLASVELLTVIISGILYLLFTPHIKILKPDKKLIIEYIQLGLPGLIITITSILMSNNLDKIFIGTFIGEKEVGYYSVALSLMILFGFIAGNLNNILLPYFSERFGNNQIPEIKELSLKLEKYISILITPISSFMFFFSSHIVNILFGESFDKSPLIISIMSVQSLVLLLTKPYSIQLISSGKIKLAMIYDLIYLGISILFFFIFIPETVWGIQVFGMGASGAALSVLISTIIHSLIVRFSTLKISNTFINKEILPLVLISLLVSYFISLVLAEISLNKFLTLLIAFPASFGIYLIILFFFNKLNSNDIKYIVDFFNLKKVIVYFYDELKTR